MMTRLSNGRYGIAKPFIDSLLVFGRFRPKTSKLSIKGFAMPYRPLLRRVIIPFIFLVALILSATARVTQKPDGSSNGSVPAATPPSKSDYADGDEQVVISSELI